ncbi:flagellar biosynthesis repressor FlbT [Oceaniglobus ichthyenteri]|uniref:flagellar biosynthesis repressor FlbT n=1 Tax=Oceaniglobus ichthyenteri TaxID=2136177 RepID=UPI000D381786|nr:flagellar biosynthesis repressor FlbT [Oceaniglobus ichthyenteri]
MSGLVLKLAPNERVLINGAVIENGSRRGRLNIVTPGANILRLRDALHPEEVNTPVRRVCYIAQMVLCGEADEQTATPQLLSGISQLSQVLVDLESQETLAQAKQAVEQKQHYYTLKHLRQLLPFEEQLFAVAQS